MAGSSTKSWWQYSKWVVNVARNMRITNPTGLELLVLKLVVGAFWDPVAKTGTRSWLQQKFQNKCVDSTTNYQGDLGVEPAHVIVEMLEIIGKDLKKVPITDAEVVFCDALIANTGNKRYGTGPSFGGASGSTVTIV